MRYLLILLFLLLAACAPRVATVPDVLAPPVAEGLEDQLLERLEANSQAFKSLVGMARVKVRQGDRSVSANQVVFVEKPARLRAETLNPFGFGSPVLLLATDGRDLSVLVPREATFYSGPASYRNLQRFTRMPLQISDLVAILLYQVPLIPHDERTLTANSAGWYMLKLFGKEGRRQELIFNWELQLTSAEYYRGDKALLKVSYDQFNPEAGYFPELAFLEVPPEDAEASVEFSDIELNVSIPQERFSLSPPAGYVERAIP